MTAVTKTCSECGKGFDPADRGPGTGMALTCSKWCGDARRARQQREYKQRRRDEAKAIEKQIVRQSRPQWLECKSVHCQRLVRNLSRSSGYCERCEIAQRDRQPALAEDGRAYEDVQALAKWNELVRKRAPVGSAWWWR